MKDEGGIFEKHNVTKKMGRSRSPLLLKQFINFQSYQLNFLIEYFGYYLVSLDLYA